MLYHVMSRSQALEIRSFEFETTEMMDHRQGIARVRYRMDECNTVFCTVKIFGHAGLVSS